MAGPASPASLAALLRSVRRVRPARDAAWAGTALSLAVLSFGLIALGHFILDRLGTYQSSRLRDIPDPRLIHSYHDQGILSAHLDSESGNVWLGTPVGLEVYHPATRLWSTLSVSDPPSALLPVRWISQDGRSILFGDGGGGVAACPAGRGGIRFLFGPLGIENFPWEKASSVCAGPSEILLASGHTLAIYDQAQHSWSMAHYHLPVRAWRSFTADALPRPELAATITALAYLPDRDTFYVGTDAGIFLRRDHKWLVSPSVEGEWKEAGPVRHLVAHAGRVGYLRHGEQGGLRLGFFGEDGRPGDLLAPSRLAAAPESLTDAAGMDSFVFLASARQFLRVFNSKSLAWEALAASETGDAPVLRGIEIFDRKAWLASDRGLLLFRTPEALWQAGREARIPVFQTVSGNTSSSLLDPIPGPQPGIHKLVAHQGQVLYVLTDRDSLGRIEAGEEALEWLAGHSQAAYSLPDVSSSAAYPLKETDVLCAAQIPGRILVGARQGVFQYHVDRHTWEEYEPERFRQKAVFGLHPQPGSEAVLAVTGEGILFASGVSVPHPDGDRILRLFSGPGHLLYSTRKGEVGLVSTAGYNLNPLLGGSVCPVRKAPFTSVTLRYPETFWATDGEGIVSYDLVERRWKDHWTVRPDRQVAGGGLQSDRVWEVRAGPALLAYRTAQGGVGLRSRHRWHDLIGDGLSSPLRDEDLTAAATSGTALWVGGGGILAPYDLARHAWGPPLKFDDRADILALEICQNRPGVLTAKGNLFLGQRPIAGGVAALASNGQTLAYVSHRRLFFHEPGQATRERPSPLPPLRSPIADVAESDAFFYLATTRRLWAYDKKNRTWIDRGALPDSPVAELLAAPGNDPLALLQDGEVLRIEPDGHLRPVPLDGRAVQRLLLWQGRPQFLTRRGDLMEEGDRSHGREDVLSDAPLLDLFERKDQFTFVQADGIRFYDLRKHRWSPGLPAPKGLRIQAARGQERVWALMSDGTLHSALVSEAGGHPSFQGAFQPENPSRSLPLADLVDAARFGDRWYFALPQFLLVYDVRLHRWLPELALAPERIARLLCSERFLAIVCESGKVFLSTEIYNRGIPHEHLGTDWLEIPARPDLETRAAGVSARGRLYLLASDSSVVEFDPFTRTSSERVPSPGRRAETDAGPPAIRAWEKIHDLAVEGETLWLATDRGLVAWPLSTDPPIPSVRFLEGQAIQELFFRPGYQVQARTSGGGIWRRLEDHSWREIRGSSAMDVPAAVLQENEFWRWAHRGKRLAIEAVEPDIPLLDPASGRFSFDVARAVWPWDGCVFVATENAVWQYFLGPSDALLDPEKMKIHRLPGIVRFFTSSGQLYAASDHPGRNYRFQDGHWIPTEVLPPGEAETLVSSDFWRWERRSDRLSGFLRTAGGKEIPIDLAATAREGRFLFDSVLDAAVDPDSDALWVSTPIGLLCREKGSTSFFPESSASELRTVTAGDGKTALLGLVAGNAARFNTRTHTWDDATPESHAAFESTLRIQTPLWRWERSQGKISGRFMKHPGTPVLLETPEGLLFSFDEVWDVEWFQGRWWAATSAGPLPLSHPFRPTALADLRIPDVGDSRELHVHWPTPADEPRLLARRSGQEPWWRYQPLPDAWKPDPALDASLPRAVAGDGRWSFETQNPSDSPRPRLLKWIHDPSGHRHELRLSNGRWSFDDARAIAVSETALWIASAQGLLRYPIPSGEIPVDPLRFDFHPFPGSRLLQHARLLPEPGGCTMLCLFTDSSVARAFRFREEAGNWEECTHPDTARHLERHEVLRNSFWTWHEGLPGKEAPPRLEGAWLHAGESPAKPITLQDGRFPFDQIQSMAVESDALWLVTRAGITRNVLDGQRLPLDRMRLYPAGGHGEQLLLATPVQPGPKPGLYLRGKDDQVLQYARDADAWLPVPDPAPVLQNAAGKEILVEFNGFWRWWRPLDFDPQVELKKPAVHLETVDSTGRWSEIGFTRGRFSFDHVLDVVVHEGLLWTATEAGLCHYPFHPSRLDLAQARLYPDLARATDLVVDRARNELFIRLQGSLSEVFSLSLPEGKPRKIEGGRNPFLSSIRWETPTFRWSREEIYDGSVAKGNRVRLEMRDARGAWQPIPLAEGLLSTSDFRDFLVHDSRLWIATPAGVVSYDLARPDPVSNLLFYPETGDTQHLLLRGASGPSAASAPTRVEPEMLCLSQQGGRDIAFRFSPRPEDGKNWREMGDSKDFRGRILEDGPWHWFREREGYSVLWRGLPQRARAFLSGRFADDVALAAASAGNQLFTYTPLGIQRYLKIPQASPPLVLEAILSQTEAGLPLPAGRSPASLLATGEALLLAIPDGVFSLRLLPRSDEFSLAQSWPAPQLPGPPSSLQLFAGPEGHVLRIRSDAGRQGFFSEFLITPDGLMPLARLPKGRLLATDSETRNAVFQPRASFEPGPRDSRRAGSLPLSGPKLPDQDPVAILRDGGRLWLVYPERLFSLEP
ncbi:MAG: hypothetical protein HYU36_17355 [Planctomycetes bacterium]|nr:hypothetical protein [Planctomycetota bacterium]